MLKSLTTLKLRSVDSIKYEKFDIWNVKIGMMFISIVAFVAANLASDCIALCMCEYPKTYSPLFFCALIRK